MALYDENASYWTDEDSLSNFVHKYVVANNAYDYFGFNTLGRIGQLVSDVMNGTLMQSPVKRTAYSDAIDDGASLSEAANNILTGNVDFDRTKELMLEEQAFNAQEAEKQRQWYERLSNTAYQRAAADLKAAGYNPALLLNGASAASSAYGSSASVGAHSAGNSQLGAAMLVSNVANALTKVISAAIGVGYI